MSSWEEMTNTIVSRMKTQIEDVYNVQVQYDNFPFNRDDENLWNDAVWIRFTVIPGDTVQNEISATNTYRTPGVAMAVIRSKLNMGTIYLNQMADYVKTAFRGVTDTGVHFRTPNLGPSSRTNEWWIATVTCPFTSDQIGS